jgi:hypothetical protein
MEPTHCRRLLSGLVAMALAFLALTARSQDTGTALAQGKASLEAGRFEEAVQHLRTAFREDPGNPDVSFSLGLAAFGAGDYETAAAAFDRVLVMRPEHDLARLELARTYFHLRLFGVAQDLFEEVKAKPETPESVRQNIDGYLARIREARSPHRIGGAMTFAVAWDDNARVSPGGTIVIPGLPRLGVPVERDAYTAQSLVLDHRWTPRPTGPSWASELLAYNALYLDQHDLNVQYLRLDSGPRWQAGRLSLGVGLNGAYMQKDDERYLGTGGARAFAGTALTRDLSLRLEVSGEKRRYWQVSEADGLAGTVALRPTWRLGRHTLSADLGFESHNADADFEGYDRFLAGLGYQLALPWRLTFLGSYLYEEWLFDGPEPLAADRRRDAVHKASAGLRRLLGSRSAVELRHTYETCESNSSLYEYDRNVTSLSLAIAF